MSDRRSSRAASKLSDDEINNLVFKLQQMIPEIRCRNSIRASAPKILKEVCNYIESLNREAEDLSERLSELLSSLDSSSSTTEEAEAIKSLIMKQ